jgi:hypothetical protein
MVGWMDGCSGEKKNTKSQCGVERNISFVMLVSRTFRFAERDVGYCIHILSCPTITTTEQRCITTLSMSFESQSSLACFKLSNR